MALRSRIITDPNEMLRIIDNMSDSKTLSDDDDSKSDDDVISTTCELSDDSDDNQPLQGGSGLGVTCHGAAPDMDTSVSDSEDGFPEMPARITSHRRSTGRGKGQRR